MNSPKPALQQLVYQGSPGKNLLFNKDWGISNSSSRQVTSENCDPNLEKANVPGGALAVFRKNDTSAAATSSLEDKHEDSTKTGQVNSNEAKEETSAGEQNTSKDIDTLHKCSDEGEVGQQLQQLKSPAKAAAAATSPGYGHGHRQHFCRSPRCASNNPDYATPPQIPPRKYLISKRHLLPGAICTRDPSTLPSSQIPLPSSSSIGKPPARPPPSSASKNPTTNTFRQLSFKDASSDTSKSVPPGKAATCSPPDTHCGEPVTKAPPACGSIVGSSPDELATLQIEEQNGVNTASETQVQEQQDGIDLKEPVNCDCYTADVGSCDAGQDVEHQRSDDNESDCIRELKVVGPEVFNDVEGEHHTPANCAEDQIPGSGSSVGTDRCESPEFAAVAGESFDSSARAVPPESGNASGKEPLPVDFCGLTDRQVSDEFLSSRAPLLESADNRLLDVDDVTKTLEQRLALEKMDATTSSSCRSSCDDGIVDIYDLAAGTSSSGSEDGEEGIEKEYILRECSTEEGRHGGIVDYMDAEVSVSQTSIDDFEDKTFQDGHAEEDFVVVKNEFLKESQISCKSTQQAEEGRVAPRFGRSKVRQLWRNDCRDSREIVTLKPTNYNRQGGDWMVDSLLEGAVNRLKPSGEGRVRLLVEAFESLMNITEPEPEKRPSRVWYFNRMGKGEVDDDGDVCEEGDQRVDCYEVSGDRFELRASMRLSLGGSSRHDVCSVDENEEMSSMRKVQDWDDRQASKPSESGRKETDGGDQDRNNGRSSTKQDETAATSPSKGQTKMNEKDRKRVQMYNEVKKQLGYKTEDNVQMKIQRYNRTKDSSKSSSVKSETESNLGSAEKSARAPRNTHLEPFRLLTEERGALKEFQFAKKLEQLFAEEERLRNPIAQGLPWTTDEPEVVPKPPVKQPTKHVDFTHYSNSRAAIRAEFDHYMAEREMYMKTQREEEERQRQIAEQEEIRRLRREMVPRAQLMPFFDQPFMPTRSSKRLTVPKEPNFKSRQHKRAKCMVFHQGST